MFDNPFKPQDVKMSNYHPEQIEMNKLNNIANNMASASRTRYEYKPKTFKDVVGLPKSYGDVLPKKDTYSDHLPTKDTYSDHLPQKGSYNDAFKGGTNGFRNN